MSYPLVMSNVAIENGHLVRGFYHENGGSFHSYVSLPEGTCSICKNRKICLVVEPWLSPTALKNDGLRKCWDDVPVPNGKSFKIPWFQSPPTRSIIQHMAKVAVLHILILHMSCRPSLERSEFGMHRMQGTCPVVLIRRSIRSPLPSGNLT